jgi:hypothetical protein
MDSPTLPVQGCLVILLDGAFYVAAPSMTTGWMEELDLIWKNVDFITSLLKIPRLGRRYLCRFKTRDSSSEGIPRYL